MPRTCPQSLGAFFGQTESLCSIVFFSVSVIQGVFVRSTKFVLAVALLVLTSSAMALPIDWGGSLGLDTTLIDNIRRSKDDVPTAKNDGTQGIVDNDNGAHFQTYVFKLNPHLIVNDAVSIKGELSSGHTRGGFWGDNATQTQDQNTGSNSYYSTVPAQRSTLNVNQLYAELYADTALVKAGRYAKEYGRGAILHAGKGTFDRFFTQYDGIQGEMRIGNFALIPHWARLATYDEGASKPEANGTRDVRESGLVARYDNKSTNTEFSLAYTKRFSEPNNDLYDINNPATNRGRTNVTLIDVYFHKKWEKVDLSVEVPMMSGDYGRVYNDGTKSKVSSSSALAEVIWSPSVRWDFGLHAGQVGGDKGSSQRFEGMQLNPNYHIAELMFRYNYTAFNEGNQSIFDSGISNARFFKLYSNYKNDKWTWSAAAIMATAMETAKAGQRSYHHEEGYSFDSTADQDDDYGMELDLSFAYQWNPNVNVSGFLGYWLVGDYYAFNNDADDELKVENVLGAGLKLGIDF